MPLESLKNLPSPARRMWERVFEELKGKYSEAKAARIAWDTVKKKYNLPKNTRKSMSVSQKSVSSDSNDSSFIDIMLGYPGSDKQVEENMGIKLDDSGWNQKPIGTIKGDMEHYYDDIAEGLRPQVDESWEGWVAVSKDFWHDENGALHAKAKIPENHAKTPEFLEKWTSGDVGVSVEFAYPEEALDYTWENGKLVPVAKDWVITGFSFTEDPAKEETKNGKR